jgi:hypothetical protein
MYNRVTAVWICWAALLLPLAAGAQSSRAWIDVGTARVRYADSIDVSALSLSPSFQWLGRSGYVAGTGTLAQMSGGATYSGALSGGISTDARRRLSVELGATAGGSAHSDASRTGQLLGSGRLYLNAAAGGGWGGGGVGSTSDGINWRRVVQGSIGAWASTGRGSGMVSITPTAVDDTIRYTDATLLLRRDARRVELLATLGTRFGDPVPSLVTKRAWGSASAVFWTLPHVGIVASAGTYPIDFTQGYPGGRFLSLAVRLAATRSNDVDATPRSTRFYDAAARAFEVRRAASGRHRIRVHAPAASAVEIMGSFSGWAPVGLAPEGNGWWGVTLSLGRRSHEINVRVNGAAWSVPPGLTSLEDEFGGASGLLVIR